MRDYVYSNEFFQTIDAMVYTCGYEECAPGHAYGPAVRSGYLIHHVLDGRGSYHVGGRLYHLEAGDAFLIKPDDLIYYEADHGHPWTYTWIGFQGIMVRQYLERSSVWDTLVFRYSIDDDLGHCHQMMFEANQRARNKDLLMTSILYRYLFGLAAHFPRMQEKGHGRRVDYVDEALKRIATGYGGHLRVDQIARELNVDRSHLHRLFKEQTGRSMQDYLLRFRVNRACQLLAETDLPVGAVARSVGYDDALYFSRLFRKAKGMSPTAYRKTAAR